MSSVAISEEALEAVAKAVARNDCKSDWEAAHMFKHFPQDYRRIARAALEAAAPYFEAAK